MIRPVGLGVCHGYEYEGDAPRTAIALPGAMLAGMPVLAFAIQPLTDRGWRVLQVWDEYLDRTTDATEWVRARLDAAVARAGEPALLVAKSLTSRAAATAAERSWPAVWLTPLLDDEEVVAGLRGRTAPALLVGGTDDPTWNGALAREVSEDVLELAGANHGLARTEDVERVVQAVGAFADRL